VTFPQCFRFELGDKYIGLQQGAKRILHMFESSILSHSAGHIPCGRQDSFQLMPELPRLSKHERIFGALEVTLPGQWTKGSLEVALSDPKFLTKRSIRP